MKPFLIRRRNLAISLLLAAGASAPAAAATLTVTSNLDNGPGTFRQAVADAQSGDTIDFNLNYPSAIAILVTPLRITKDLTIVGPGADKLTFDGNNAGNPLLQISSPSSLTISGVTFTHADASAIHVPAGSLTLSDCAFVNNVGKSIIMNGPLQVDDCVFSDNRANNISSVDVGAAIYLSGGTATISNSTFVGNESADGCGAIYNGGNMTIRNSTFSNNRSIGGNSSQGGALCSPGSLAVEATTFSGNYARGFGGTLVANQGTITGSTFKGNSSTLGGDGIKAGTGLVVSRSILQSCRDSITSGGDNLVSDGSCFSESTALNDRIGLDPLLGALADNGGSTQTLALQAGSPAIDQVTINAATCTGTDQRGLARPSGKGCDIGAYEWDSDVLFSDGFDAVPEAF